MIKDYTEVAEKVIDKEEKGSFINENYRTCKLISVDTTVGTTNNTPILKLTYEFVEDGDIGEDIFCFTEKSLETILSRFYRAYLGFTGERLTKEDMKNQISIKKKFEEIIGKESLVREYKNKKGYIGYNHYADEDSEKEILNDFWLEKDEAEEDKESDE